MVYKNLIIIY